MPIFEYQCEGCGERFEEIVLGRDTSTIECPRCGSPETSRLMSSFSWSGTDGRGSASSCGSCSPSAGACKSCKG